MQIFVETDVHERFLHKTIVVTMETFIIVCNSIFQNTDGNVIKVCLF